VWPIMLKLDGSNYVGWIVKGNQIIPTSLTAGSGNYTHPQTYDSSVHKYFRVREANGSTYWETSSDANTWTTWETRSNQISMTNLEARIQAGPYNSEASSTTAIFDNFSIGTQSTTVSSISQFKQRITARFNLGVYNTSGDKQDIDSTPRQYAITGYDILEALNDTVGDSFSVGAGRDVLTEVENILVTRGYTQYIIDQQSTGVTLPATKVWAIADNPKWLTVVNDLLGSIGYAGVWSDWDGRLRIEPYLSPNQRSPEWFYDIGNDANTMVSFKRSVERDLYDAPNRWVFVQSNRAGDVAPIEGAGQYTYINNSTGDSSVEARGRVISTKIDVDAADQASLIAAAQVTIDADMSLATKLSVETFPNPLHWHFDRFVYSDPELGLFLDVMGTQWKWQVGANGMSQEWTVLQ